MHIAGFLGMRRRVFTFPAGHGLEGLNLASSLGAAALTAGILVCLWAVVKGFRRGRIAGGNPWRADTLEWDVESPPPVYGTVHIPTVVTLHPLWDHHDEESDPEGERILDGGRLTLSTSWRRALPFAVAEMPEDTLTPLFAALALVLVFAGVLLREPSLMATGAGATLIAVAAWVWPQTPKAVRVPSVQDPARAIVTAVDEGRGLFGTKLFIATEAALFVMLFWAYVYLGPYPTEKPPELRYPLPMLGILLASSAVAHLGETCVARGREGLGRIAIGGTLVLAVAFLVLQFFEYASHLRTLTPQSSAYGSIFYTITTVHAVHLVLGALMLAYVALLPKMGSTGHPPHKALENATLYWHFVDVVWIFIVAILYVAPHFTR
jgi:heme/copper-type cytochrome/quinol oxidase subunit 3